MLNEKNVFCRITLDSTKECLFFLMWKIVFRCFEAPCEIWCKVLAQNLESVPLWQPTAPQGWVKCREHISLYLVYI